MTDYVQISAQISEATRKRLDLYARESGLKKGRLIEDAINTHLDELEEIPAEYLVPRRIVVDQETWEWMVDAIDNPREPTPALRELMRHRDDED